MALVIKNLPASEGYVRDFGFIPGSGRSPGKGNKSPLQYSCLENPMDREAWQATVQGVSQSQTQLKRLSMHAVMRKIKVIITLNKENEYTKTGVSNPQAADQYCLA